MAQLKTFEEWQKDSEKLAGAVARMLASEEGRLVMEELDRQWIRGDLRGKTPEETYFKLGARAMVLHLKNLAELGKPKP